MTTVTQLQANIRKQANKDKAKTLRRYFQTEPGGYGEGDQFLGISVPSIRQIIKPFHPMELGEVKYLIQSNFHEERLAALFILIYQYERSRDPKKHQAIYRFVEKYLPYINNWDLVDTIAPGVIGPYLFQCEDKREILQKWVTHKNLWRRRIAIISTLHFIRNHHFDATLNLSTQLLDDKEDLIHKATGWMLREVGNRNRKVAESFLIKHYQHMPRTMLRYAIERFPENRRQDFLKGKAI